ncbi:MAG TPA: zinc-dependent alcohol dehydrogenase family protein [Pirellulaceae bacterium]|nr:zinc-dependent alcohol dehydrogenase family protein [Pirellulaceae bacterium]
MLAWELHAPHQPLVRADRPIPEPGAGQIVLRVRACGVCRTDLHVVDGELPDPQPLVVPGHEIVGEVTALGARATRFTVGERVGVPWLGQTCRNCRYCTSGRENLCDDAQFTGYTLDGGYAEYAVADEEYCFRLPRGLDDLHAAPLLCAGLIGFRSLKLAGNALRLGIYGFGAAAHIVAQVASWQGREIYAFTRKGDTEAQQFARDFGAVWAGDSHQCPPNELDAAIIFAPVGALIPAALAAVAKGGTVVCGGIHMTNIPSFEYRLLWGERVLRSVANLTRADGEEFLAMAPQVPVRTHVQPYSLADANRALDDIRHGQVQGAAILVP